MGRENKQTGNTSATAVRPRESESCRRPSSQIHRLKAHLRVNPFCSVFGACTGLHLGFDDVGFVVGLECDDLLRVALFPVPICSIRARCLSALQQDSIQAVWIPSTVFFGIDIEDAKRKGLVAPVPAVIGALDATYFNRFCGYQKASDGGARRNTDIVRSRECSWRFHLCGDKQDRHP